MSFGPWTRVEGREPQFGGNGAVWICRNEAGDQAAVKVLRRNSKPGSERYRRFQDEVQFLSSAAARRKGVVRLLNAHVPDVLAQGDTAWLAMPVGQPLEESLGPTRTPQLVALAIAEVAETLAALQSERIFHRDLKPSNLLQVDGEWQLADFGLVAYPEKDDFTAPEHGVGSRHYIAPEIETGAPDPNLGLADVYSLAKTLWVLIARQRYPYPGPHRVSEPLYNLSDHLISPELRPLDFLIEAATSIAPAARPTMAEFSADLATFAQGPARARASADGGLKTVQQRILLRTQVADAQRSELRVRADRAREHHYRFRDLALRPAYSAFLGAVGSTDDSGLTGRSSEELSESIELFQRWGFSRPDGQLPYGQIAGVRSDGARVAALNGFQIDPMGHCHMTAALVFEVRFGGTAVIWHETINLVAGTATAEGRVSDLAAAMRDQLAATLERYEAATDRAAARARPGEGDTSAPLLRSFGIDGSPVTLGGSGGIVTIRARIADEPAGVADTWFSSSPCQVRFTSPSGKQFIDGMFQPGRNLADGDSFDGTYIEHLHLPPQFESGEWRVQSFLLVDQVGNSISHARSALQDADFQTTFVVR